MKTRRILLFLLAAVLLLPACREKNNPDSGESTLDAQTRYYVNTFCYNMMSTYYLWEKEIADGLAGWKLKDDPIQKVKDIRYKDSRGNDIDRWTMVTDDYASLNGSVTGNSCSPGLDFSLYYYDSTKSRVVAVVTYTYADSPAREAGLARGDVIMTLNGKEMTADNYLDVIYGSLYSDSTFSATLGDGRTVQITPRQMYLDPVNVASVIEENGEKYAYLHYTNFTMDSCSSLEQVFRTFREEGCTQLILDLRYNGGGYLTASQVLASLIAPPEAIGNIYLTQVYNELLTRELDNDPIPFQTDYSYENTAGEKVALNIIGSKPDFSKVYVIMTGSSASASECVVCGLSPYMDITLAGEQSHGKYCAGIIVDGPTWYGWTRDDLGESEYKNGVKYTDNWAIYVMYSRYADKDGVTRCMPDGLTPDVAVTDNPLDGVPLGDPSETMLAAVLAQASGKAVTTRSNIGETLRFSGEEPYRHRGILIRDL